MVGRSRYAEQFPGSWLLLQHVLPKGFRRARNFGFLHPNSKRLIALLHLVLKVPPSPVQMPAKLRLAGEQ